MEKAVRRRVLTLFDVLCIGVNAIIGSSIFLFPGQLAARLGPASILAFGLTGLLLASVALCFAEAAGRFESHGGPYLYARAALGETTGFGVGWLCWLTEILSWAAVADGVSTYLGYFDARWAGPLAVKSTAAAVILVMGAINYRGVKLGAWTTNAFTLAKLAPLALLIAAGLPKIRAANMTPFAPHGLRPLGGACFLAYFAFQGFEVVPVPAGEAVDPKRTVPAAVLGSLAIASVFYMLVQTAAVGLVPALGASAHPLADAAAVALGPLGAAAVVAGAVISTVGFNAGCALGGPRYLAALGEQGDLPEAAAALHPRYGTPYVAVALTTALALAGALALDFNRLVDIGNVVICAEYLATCAAVPILRRRLGPSDGFRLPLGPAIPVFALGATVWLGAQGGMGEVAFALALLAAGFAARAVLRRAAACARIADACPR